jgi:hypothetical protein
MARPVEGKGVLRFNMWNLYVLEKVGDECLFMVYTIFSLFRYCLVNENVYMLAYGACHVYLKRI